MVRYRADGSIDSTFAAGGRMLTDFGGRNFGSAVAIDSEARIVVAGFDDFPPYYDFAVARYDTNGRSDPGFGSGRTVLTEFGANSWINAVAVHNDGSIVAVGYVRSPGGADFALARLTSDR